MQQIESTFLGIQLRLTGLQAAKGRSLFADWFDKVQSVDDSCPCPTEPPKGQECLPQACSSGHTTFGIVQRPHGHPFLRPQVKNESLQTLYSQRACDDGCWLWTSITNNSYQTAELLATGLLLGRSRIVPEFSFLDSRGVGALEGFEQAKALAQLSQGDALDPSWRPQRGENLVGILGALGHGFQQAKAQVQLSQGAATARCVTKIRIHAFHRGVQLVLCGVRGGSTFQCTRSLMLCFVVQLSKGDALDPSPRAAGFWGFLVEALSRSRLRSI